MLKQLFTSVLVKVVDIYLHFGKLLLIIVIIIIIVIIKDETTNTW